MTSSSLEELVEAVKKDYDSKTANEKEEIVVNVLKAQAKRNKTFRDCYTAEIDVMKEAGFSDDQINKIASLVSAFISAQIPAFASVSREAVEALIVVAEVYLAIFYRDEIEKPLVMAV